MFVVAFAAVTELVLGFSVNMSELFATLIAGKLEVCFEVVVIFIVMLALFDWLVTKENEIPFTMDDVVGRDVLRGNEVGIETVLGFVLKTLEVHEFDIVSATSGALDMSGKVIVNLLVAFIVAVWSVVMSDVMMLDIFGDVCAWTVVISVRVTVNVVLTCSTLRLVEVIDVLKGSIDMRVVICSDTCVFVVSQPSLSDLVRTSGYQPYS